MFLWLRGKLAINVFHWRSTFAMAAYELSQNNLIPPLQWKSHS